MTVTHTGSPKTIWFLWLQRLDEAPHVVKECFASWKSENPGWNLVVLDESNIVQYVDLQWLAQQGSFLSPQAMSDILRINLLHRFGGVWVDATCFCCRPLDEWLGEHMNSDFFAFSEPGPDRPISSWFMAATPDSTIAARYCRMVNAYWSDQRFFNQHNLVGRATRGTVEKRLRRSSYRSVAFRLCLDAMKHLRVYPYFWFHYTFALLILQDSAVRQAWDRVAKLGASDPHRLLTFGRLRSLNPDLKAEIDSCAQPIYKLTWKYGPEEYTEDKAMHYLLEKHRRRHSATDSSIVTSNDPRTSS